ncbi:MAG: NUDIX hydrolase [Acetomicrobium sp.]
MDKDEQCISSREVYSGKIVKLSVDEVRLPNGHVTRREVVKHAPAVAILAVNDKGEIVLVRQFRYATGKELLEVPAGIMEEGESPVETAKRELREEVGYDAKNIEHIASFYSSPGFANEIIHLFYATEIFPSKLDGDEDEIIEKVIVAPKECQRLIEDKKIEDAKTFAALMWYLNRRRDQ